MNPVTLIPMDVKVVNQIVEDRDRLATALGECAAAATRGAQQWLEEVNRLTAELSSYHTGLVHALGLLVEASKEEVVEAAARAWSYTQRRLVEGVLVDEGVTELPGAWVQDDGPHVSERPILAALSESPWRPDESETYAGGPAVCTSKRGAHRCELGVGHSGDHRRYVGAYEWEFWKREDDGPLAGDPMWTFGPDTPCVTCVHAFKHHPEPGECDMDGCLCTSYVIPERLAEAVESDG